MKQELILHIGMGKTGTTALQQFFGLNRKRLRNQDIYYPKYGSVAHAHHLLSPFRPNNLKGKWKFKTVSEWAPKLSRTRHKKILLSSELIAWASSSEVVEFCEALKQWFEVTVVIYVRRQDNIIMANYNQLVKAGSQRKDLDEIWEDDAARFDYLKVIEPWAKCLGKTNVVVRAYEKQQFYRGDIRHDFMHSVFGSEIPADYILSTGNSNPRLHPLAIAYKLYLFQLFSDPLQVGEFNEALLSYSSELDTDEGNIFSNQSLLSPATRNLIMQRSSAHNEFVAREYLGREDGVLFYEPLPDSTEVWAGVKLTRAEARVITRVCGELNPELLQMLFSEIRKGLDSIDFHRRSAADFMRSTLPKTMLGGLEKKSLFTIFKWKYRPEKGKAEDASLLLVSVHFPMVDVAPYKAEIVRQLGDCFVNDYADRPLGMSNTKRKFNTVISSARYAQLIHEGREPVCVHGHFMPLKYRFLQSTLRKRYVTWMTDPIERLAAQYEFWMSSSFQGFSGELRRRMIDENWSLEQFAFCPELQNIYSRYLWGFPLQLFDFIGVAEFADSEVLRFSRDVLGMDVEPAATPQVEAGPRTSLIQDGDLKQRMERFHNEDVALYRRALELRNSRNAENAYEAC